MWLTACSTALCSLARVYPKVQDFDAIRLSSPRQKSAISYRQVSVTKYRVLCHLFKRSNSLKVPIRSDSNIRHLNSALTLQSRRCQEPSSTDAWS